MHGYAPVKQRHKPTKRKYRHPKSAHSYATNAVIQRHHDLTKELSNIFNAQVLHGQGYDFKSDVWSLGCLLYEFATLKSPFEAPNQTLYDIFKRINKGEFDELPDLFSQELRELVSRMLAKDPRRRPTAAEAFEFAQMAVEALGDKPSGQTLMLDIVDMCKLLDYEEGLCLVRSLPFLPRSYFEIPDEKATPNAKFYYFTCLVLWLLSLNAVRVEEKVCLFLQYLVCVLCTCTYTHTRTHTFIQTA